MSTELTPSDFVEPTTVVLVDPTAADGETSLDAIGDDVHHVAIVTLLNGLQSAALREYADVEGIDVVSAGWLYLDQVAARIARDRLTVETVVATGPDTAYELALIAHERHAARIVLPASVARTERKVVEWLGRTSDATIVVAELVTA